MDICQKCGGWCCMHYENEYGEIIPVICDSFDVKTVRCKNYDVRPINCVVYPLKCHKHHPCPLWEELYASG